jgi:glycosyltransferase involved in cell wall biosynthesis
MRILMLSPYVPWQVHGGGAIRIFNILKELVQLGHEVVLFAAEGDPSLNSERRYDLLCKEIITHKLPTTGRLAGALGSMFSFLPYGAVRLNIGKLRRSFPSRLREEHFDVVWVNVIYLAGMLPEEMMERTTVVLDESESDVLVWTGYARKGNWPERAFAALNLVKVKAFEKRFLPKLDAVFCVSEKETTLMRGRVRAGTLVRTAPNGVDLDHFRVVPLSQRSDNYILLGGIMNFRRNIDAAVWFTQRIFPRVRASIPEADLWLVGASPSREVLQLQDVPGVHVTGTVKDTREYFARASVLVAPYRFGAGTRLKMLEGMATGTPIVSTSAGCQGIDAVDGQHLLISDDETGFADRVVELLRDRALAARLAAASRELVEAKYSWKKIVGTVEPELRELVERRASQRNPHEERERPLR